jgi:hypothetical protein
VSGKRRITVDEAQWSALQRQARQLKDLMVNAPKLVADLQRQTQSELARVSAQMESRQRSAEQAIGALSDQTRKLEADTNRRLRDQANEMNRRLTETAGQLREETNAALARQQQAWRSELSAERERQRAELARLESQVRRTAQASAAAAETWLRDAGLMHDLIRDELPHERFAPGQLAALDRRLTTARQNAEGGQSQAALALAQGAYHDLSELRVEVELLEQEWTGLHTVAYEALLKIDGLAAESAKQVIEAGAAGNTRPVDLDVDYWSGGALSELRSDLAGLLARVRDTENPLTTEELGQLTETQLPQLETRLSDTVERAQMRLLASQWRVNVAEVVATTLGEIGGFGVEDSLWERLDSRRTFMAKLQHDNGNEIIVSVAPAAEDQGDCVLRLLSYDYDTASQTELDDRAHAITEGLRARGIAAADQGCESGEPDPSLLDFERVRHAAEPAAQ